jgi:potassium-transporting ATPase KdpC subunit
MTGFAYPFIITEISTAMFPEKAQGSLILSNGKIIGSALIGQTFSRSKYFHGRPSALQKAYDASNSGGSNIGPSNKKLFENIDRRINEARAENDLEHAAPVPADMVLASASGLDPHISIETVFLQTARVARARGLSETAIKKTVAEVAEGHLGRPQIVNVLKLNLAIDGLRH